MNRYFAFRRMLEFMADYAEVVDADMNYYNGSMRICGEGDGQSIVIELTIKDKEEETDGN